MIPIPEVKKPEEKKEVKKPSYLNVRGQKIFKAEGKPIQEVDKIFTPADAEELELCEYFTKLGNLQKIS